MILLLVVLCPALSFYTLRLLLYHISTGTLRRQWEQVAKTLSWEETPPSSLVRVKPDHLQAQTIRATIRKDDLEVVLVIQPYRVVLRAPSLQLPDFTLSPHTQSPFGEKLESSLQSASRGVLWGFVLVLFLVVIGAYGALAEDLNLGALGLMAAFLGFLSGVVTFIMGRVRTQKQAQLPHWISPEDAVRTGDEAWDMLYRIRGKSDAATLALVTAKRRKRLTSFPDYIRVYFKHDTLTLLIDPHNAPLGTPGAEGFAHESAIQATLKDGLNLLKNLSKAKAKPPAGLLKHVKSDPIPGVRMRSLQLLIKQYPRHTNTDKAAHHALDDQVPEIRALAEAWLRGDDLSQQGQLSLATIPEQEGQLSLDTREKQQEGQLSLNTQAQGQLSIKEEER